MGFSGICPPTGGHLFHGEGQQHSERPDTTQKSISSCQTTVPAKPSQDPSVRAHNQPRHADEKQEELFSCSSGGSRSTRGTPAFQEAPARSSGCQGAVSTQRGSQVPPRSRAAPPEPRCWWISKGTPEPQLRTTQKREPQRHQSICSSSRGKYLGKKK